MSRSTVTSVQEIAVLACTHIALAATRSEHSYPLYMRHDVVALLQCSGEHHREHAFNDFYVSFVVIDSPSYSWLISWLYKAVEYALLYFMSTLCISAFACSLLSESVNSWEDSQNSRFSLLCLSFVMTPNCATFFINLHYRDVYYGFTVILFK